ATGDAKSAAKAADESSPAAREAAEKLKERIESKVGVPEDWHDKAKGYSTIAEFNNNLMIRTTAENHRAIQGLLAEIRVSPEGKGREGAALGLGRQADELRRAGKYQEALEVAGAALAQDEKSPAAKAMVELIQRDVAAGERLPVIDAKRQAG